MSSDGKRRRYRKASLSDSEIMTILIVFQFGSFRNFKHYYLFFIRQHMKDSFPNAVSYNRFVELESRVFFQMMFFLNLSAFGRCPGISFVDSTMVPVCHNLRRYANKVFKGLATDGKGTMGWCHGFKLHLVCNDRGEIITFRFTGANVDDRDPKVWAVLARTLYGKLFADRGYISPKLFDMLFEDGVHLVTGIRTNMKNKLMPMWDKVMLRKRCIIETINDMLKNTAQLVHSRHRSVNNFIMSMIAALAAYCFFGNKPQALQGYSIENTKQLMLFWYFLSRTGVMICKLFAVITLHFLALLHCSYSQRQFDIKILPRRGTTKTIFCHVELAFPNVYGTCQTLTLQHGGTGHFHLVPLFFLRRAWQVAANAHRADKVSDTVCIITRTLCAYYFRHGRHV